MSNSKISALTSATTPLAGTETLPIVQSSTTKKVATDDLTVKNIRSNATSGILQIAGPAAASTRVVTVPDANWTAARTDAAQSFTGNQTISSGNVVIGTSGKGVDFSAVVHAGSTSKLLADYEEGTFTPTIGGATTAGTGTYTVQQGKYTKTGNVVAFSLRLGWSNLTGAAGNLVAYGLPFTATSDTNYVCAVSTVNAGIAVGIGLQFCAGITGNTTRVVLYASDQVTGASTTIAIDTTGNLYLAGTYHV